MLTMKLFIKDNIVSSWKSDFPEDVTTKTYLLSEKMKSVHVE
nr:MAG TPA: hypothetical protein [Caudoviricetes sp.]